MDRLAGESQDEDDSREPVAEASSGVPHRAEETNHNEPAPAPLEEYTHRDETSIELKSIG